MGGNSSTEVWRSHYRDEEAFPRRICTASATLLGWGPKPPIHGSVSFRTVPTSDAQIWPFLLRFGKILREVWIPSIVCSSPSIDVLEWGKGACWKHSAAWLHQYTPEYRGGSPVSNSGVICPDILVTILVEVPKVVDVG